MKLEKINQWLILISNVGVLAGIIILAAEINQNTVVARSSARQAITEMVSSRPMLAVENEDVARLSLKFLNNEPLTQVERLQAFSRFYATLRDWENIHYQYQTGMLTPDEWRGFRLNLKSVLSMDIVREYWDNEQQYFSQRFQDEVAAVLTESAQEGPGNPFNYVFDKSTGADQ